MELERLCVRPALGPSSAGTLAERDVLQPKLQIPFEFLQRSFKNKMDTFHNRKLRRRFKLSVYVSSLLPSLPQGLDVELVLNVPLRLYVFCWGRGGGKGLWRGVRGSVGGLERIGTQLKI